MSSSGFLVTSLRINDIFDRKVPISVPVRKLKKITILT